MEYIDRLGISAKEAEIQIAQLSTKVKNEILLKSAQALLENCSKILEINKKDVENAISSGVKKLLSTGLLLQKKG